MITISKELTKDFKDVKFIDLFAGIGGFHLALKSFGAKCVFSSEWDKAAQETYHLNFGYTPQGDITKIKEADIPSYDILCAGFPCQAFSISGKRLGFDDARGTLFFDVARLAKYHQPKILFLENVKNFAKHDNGNTLKVVEKTLSEIGYDIHYKVLSASDFGVPQARERIYIIAFRKDLKVKNFKFPQELPVEKCVRNILLAAKDVEGFVINRPDVLISKEVSVKISPTSVRLGQVGKGGQGDRIYGVNGQAITLSAYGGGTGAKTGLYLVDGVVRKLAPRECARLLGLPDSFKVHPNKNQSYKQFGNGVVVDVLQHIMCEVTKTEVFRGQ